MGWHEHYFFMSSSGWECIPEEEQRSDLSLRWVFGTVPNHHRDEVTSLTSVEQAHTDAIIEMGSVDYSVLVHRENEGFLGYIVLDSLPKVNPLLRIGKSSRDHSPHDSSKTDSPLFSLGGAS